jgi:hypothetical protein
MSKAKRKATSKVVDLSGHPVAPTEAPYDRGVADVLERALVEVKAGRVTGVAVVMTGPHETGFTIDGHYHGARLSLISGCCRLLHKLNRDLDL